MASKEISPPQEKEKNRVCKFFTLSEVIGGIVQLIGIIAALIFGVWAIKSYDVAQRANKLSTIANQLAFLSLCASSEEIANSTACIGALQGVSLSSIAKELGISTKLVVAVDTFTRPFTTLTATALLTTTQTFPTTTTFVSTVPSLGALTTVTSSLTAFSTATLTATTSTTLFTTVSITMVPMSGDDNITGRGRSKGLPLNAIIGIIVGISFLLGVILMFCIGCRRRKAWNRL